MFSFITSSDGQVEFCIVWIFGKILHSTQSSIYTYLTVVELLLAGVPQTIMLILNPGSQRFNAVDLSLQCSDNLELLNEGNAEEVIHVPAVMPYQEVEYTMTAIAGLGGTQPKQQYPHQVIPFILQYPHQVIPFILQLPGVSF